MPANPKLVKTAERVFKHIVRVIVERDPREIEEADIPASILTRADVKASEETRKDGEQFVRDVVSMMVDDAYLERVGTKIKLGPGVHVKFKGKLPPRDSDITVDAGGGRLVLGPSPVAAAVETSPFESWIVKNVDITIFREDGERALVSEDLTSTAQAMRARILRDLLVRSPVAEIDFIDRCLPPETRHTPDIRKFVQAVLAGMTALGEITRTGDLYSPTPILAKLAFQEAKAASFKRKIVPPDQGQRGPLQ